MALNSSRPVLSSVCTALRQCRPASQPLLRQAAARPLSTTSARLSEEAVEDERPRWSYTPERMKGPNMSIRVVKDPRRKIWKVNEDPALLDAMYNRFLGPHGDKMLPDEIKWLAITHKSFDYARRGFNTRLAYYGRQILALESTRSILISSFPPSNVPDKYSREPFRSPALEMVDKLNTKQPRDIIYKEKMAGLAMEIGLNQVVRWKPGKPENLEGSGQTVVLTTCLYAIIGAIGLQHGAEVAHKVARERILNRIANMKGL
ncbi:ribonuclease-III-like-domain-containing protein [Schizothecium vesticola]|uniref:Ribonuclease-III-like-domain-containing protein n=1 Tax=Schizothecium vesticola TaxID=314040 RepID=A0AA40ELB4_9PEZI|nr:ribonuclease-III-like-domain-containing protein [Schizothecium vesticola]